MACSNVTGGRLLKKDLGDQAQTGTREYFGIAIQAHGPSAAWILKFMGALEAGDISARAQSDPPETGNEILDAAGSPSHQWWKEYRTFCDAELIPPLTWTWWLHDNVGVELEPLLKLFKEQLEIDRESFRRQRRIARGDHLWSELEALAWFATDAPLLVAKLRDFGYHRSESVVNARIDGVRYLRFHVAMDHCSCGSNRPLSLSGAPERCKCLKSAWKKMVDALTHGRLTARLCAENGKSHAIDAKEFTDAHWEDDTERFWFLRGGGELLFERIDNPIRLTDAEIRKWISDHPEYTDGKTARNAFMKQQPRAKGCSKSFEVIWKEMHPRGRGHPKRSVKSET